MVMILKGTHINRKQDDLWESDIISLLLSYIILKTRVIISLFMFL